MPEQPHALRHHPDVHAPAAAWSEDQRLHVAVVSTNPFRWRTRRELANDTRRFMALSANVVLHFGELAYGDRPFDLTDPAVNPLDVQFRGPHELFHKENLLNAVVRTFPPGWQYGAIIDADFHFTRHDWALETVHQLQHYDWVQLFSSYTNVTGETEPGHGHRPIGTTDGFAYRFVQNGYRLPDGYDAGWTEPATSGGASSGTLGGVGAPGGAWAFRKTAFDAVGGLLDRCILGSGDWYMAFGLAGEVSTQTVEERRGHDLLAYTPQYVEYIRAWQRRAALAIKRNIGYVDQYAVHHFHGPMAKRGYATRDQILAANAFDPYVDVFPDWQGILQLSPEKPRLRDAIRAYFLSRSEDLPHVPKAPR